VFSSCQADRAVCKQFSAPFKSLFTIHVSHLAAALALSGVALPQQQR